MNSVDTHAHVFRRGLKLADVRRYAPTYDAGVEDYLRQLDANGITHGVLVQPSFLGTDNSFMLAALRQHRSRLRGIAVVDPAIAAGGLDSLAADGVVGIRLNLVGLAIPDFKIGPWPALLRNVARLGWQVEIHRPAADLPTIVGPLLDAEVNVVLDHFGRPDPQQGAGDLGFRYLLSVADTGKVWIKLSGAYRNGDDGAGEKIAKNAMPLLIDAYSPQRLLWGSDWPHTQFETVVDFKSTRMQLERWLPDPQQRQTVLGATPTALFRF